MNKFQVLAHRGLASEFVPENTLKAFADAIHAGADVIETDVQCTKDGVAIIFHDDDLVRMAGIPKKVAECSWKEISVLDIGFGKRIPSLEEALKDFPATRFNLDVKSKNAVGPTAEVVNRLNTQERILISSFSDRRSSQTASLIRGSVRTSAGTLRVLGLWISSALGATPLFQVLGRKIQALQIPVSRFGLRFDSKRFIGMALASGLEVHYWTINDLAEVLRLQRLGATGIVTDCCDLVVAELGK
jgi:glycerophosphoryl diester phosphodiesterase